MRTIVRFKRGGSDHVYSAVFSGGNHQERAQAYVDIAPHAVEWTWHEVELQADEGELANAQPA